MKRIHHKSLVVTLSALALGGSALAPIQVFGQINSTWIGNPSGNGTGNWSNNANWNPANVPGTDPNFVWNVTIPYHPANDQFNGPSLDVDVTVHDLTLVNRGFLDNQLQPIATNLTVTGTTSFTTTAGHDGEYGVIWNFGGIYSLGTLSNYTAATKTLESGWIAAFQSGTPGNYHPGTTKFRGADVVQNKGVLSVSGVGSAILNQDNNSNALTNLAVNEGGLFLNDGASFTTAGNLTNNGALEIGGKDTTIFTVTGSLTNYDPGTHVLTGGFYTVGADPGATATLRFPGADIRTLSNANITLRGAGASITDLSGQNALRNLAGLQGGRLTSAGTLTITPDGGTFSNNAASHTINEGANITIAGNHTSTNAGTTAVSAPTDSANTSLIINGSSIIDGGGLDFGGTPGVNTQYHTTLQVINGIEFRGAYLTGTGTTFADVGLIQGSVLNPGHSPGQLTFDGDLTLDDTTTTEIQIGGLGAANEFDQIVQTNGTLTLGGRLLVSFLDDFENSISGDDSFEIITSDATLSGSFNNAADGARIATNDGKGTFVVTYAGQNKVTLSDFLPPPKVVSVTKMPNEYLRITFEGYPNSSYELQASPDLNPDNFETIATFGVGEGNTFAVEDIDSDNQTRRFYRIVYPLGPAVTKIPGSNKPESHPRAAARRTS